MTPNEPASPSEELSALFRASSLGNVDAFRTLYEKTSARLYAVALRIVRRPEIAEEVLQDAYVTMWTKAIQQSGGHASVFAWMATIVRHRAIDAIRATREEPRDLSCDPLEDDAEMSVEERALSDARSDAIRRCVATLDASPRQAILLAYYQGYSHEEVAHRMETPLGTVKSWLRRGLAKLRRCLEQ